MKKIILILTIIPVITLGQVYTYEDYDELWGFRGELIDCMHDFIRVQKMDYIDNTTRQRAHDLCELAMTSVDLLNHATSLIYVYSQIDNAGDRIRVGSFIKEQIDHIIKELELEEKDVTETLFLIDNTYLITCGDKAKGIIKKAIRKLKSLELRTE
jgi:hypothetical protein